MISNPDNKKITSDPNNQMVPSSGDEFSRLFGEPLSSALDLNSWKSGPDLEELYIRLHHEVKDAVEQASRIRDAVRKEVIPRLKTAKDAPKHAGLYRATPEDLREVHHKVLFNGGVEACDANCNSHDTLVLGIIQIAVCLTSYRGDQGTWSYKLYRRDLRSKGMDPVNEALTLLENRSARDKEANNSRDQTSQLAKRGIMTYAERAVLTDKSTAPWRLGHGNPVPYELLTGSGHVHLIHAGIDVLSRLIAGHKRFVFIPSDTTNRLALTIGDCLRALEYVVIKRADEDMKAIVDEGNYRGAGWYEAKDRLTEFIQDVGRKVVYGVYKASAQSPARLFYAHEDYVHEAALIAMADSVLQEHRGFPMLIDLADITCRTLFGAEVFNAGIELAYSNAGAPFQYLGERATRHR